MAVRAHLKRMGFFAPIHRFFGLTLALGVVTGCSQLGLHFPGSGGGGDGNPIEGVRNDNKSYEFKVVTNSYNVSIAYDENGYREARIYDRGDALLRDSLLVVKSQVSNRLHFDATNFHLEMEAIDSVNPSGSSVRYLAAISTAAVSIHEDYFSTPLPSGLGAGYFSCDGFESQAPFADGEGSASHPYIICSIGQLESIGGIYLNKHFRMMNDLSFEAAYKAPTGWAPIGTAAEPFAGVFDGGGHTVSGLKSIQSYQNVGLFGKVQRAEIKNLVIANAQVSGTANVGILAGNANSIIVDSVQTSGSVDVTSLHNGGGLIGTIEFSSTIHTGCDYQIQNSSSSASVTVTRDNAGGLIGKAYCSSPASTLRDSHATGSVLATAANAQAAGGLIGYIFYARIDRTWASGNVQTGFRAGGFIGQSYGTHIYDSYSTGNVKTMSAGDSSAGGFMGVAFNNGVSFENCYASGAVEATSGFASGFLGATAVGAVNMVFTNVFSASTVTAPSSIGGIIGYFDPSASWYSLQNLRWLNGGATECMVGRTPGSDCVAVANISDFYSKTNQPMVNWDFDLIWLEVPGALPILR